MGKGSPTGSRNYNNGGFANGERKRVFLEDEINSSNCKVDDEGLEARSACCREPKEEFEQ